MKNLLNKAILFAYEKHQGQLDKANKPYIVHPIMVSHSHYIVSETSKIVTILHDTMEDCEVTREELIELGLTSRMVGLIELLTRKKGERYFEYIDRIANSGDSTAICVKLADLEHNSMLSRFDTYCIKDLDRVRKYQKATEMLLIKLKNGK